MNTEFEGDRRILQASRSIGGPELTPAKEMKCADHATTLVDAGAEIIISNGGLHLKIKHDRYGIVDYWPTTGKWWIARHQQRGHGLRPLMLKLGFTPRK